MKIKTSEQLKTLGGVPMYSMDEKTKERIYITFKTSVVDALLRPSRESVSGMERMKMWELAKKIYASEDEVELSLDEVKTIRSAVEKAYDAPLILGQIFDLLENAAKGG